MKKILLILMMLVAATATMSAQDELEQTAAPIVCIEETDNCFVVSIVNSNEDPYADIFYNIYYEDQNYNEWRAYDGPITIEQAGTYTVLAYAQTPGKSASYIVTQYFVAYRKFIITDAYDFIMNAIYYKKRRDPSVWVTTSAIKECINDMSYPPHAAEQSYSGDVIVPSSVEYDGETYPVTAIDNNAFEGCDISSVDLPNSIGSIGEYAFYNCTGLKAITIPESVTKIGQNAFSYCADLNRVICKALTPPAAVWTAFGYSYNSITLFVPNESLEAYRAHQVWSRFTHIVPFIGAGPGDINGDGSVAISDVSGIIDMLLESEELPAYCDVNGDGIVSIADVSALIDILLGY